MTVRTPIAAQAVGLSQSHVNHLVREGIIVPVFLASGRGERHGFDERNIQQLRAYIRIREQLGDGLAARAALAQLVPQMTASTATIPLHIEQTLAL
jgi:hypothetical protein